MINICLFVIAASMIWLAVDIALEDDKKREEK